MSDAAAHLSILYVYIHAVYAFVECRQDRGYKRLSEAGCFDRFSGTVRKVPGPPATLNWKLMVLIW